MPPASSSEPSVASGGSTGAGIGMSTGGSVALLAMDHPDLVRGLVIVSSASRLSARGIDSQRRLANLLRARDRRAAGAESMAMLGGGPVSERMLGVLGWMLGPTMFSMPYSDMLATITAEEQFNVREGLHEITARRPARERRAALPGRRLTRGRDSNCAHDDMPDGDTDLISR